VSRRAIRSAAAGAAALVLAGLSAGASQAATRDSAKTPIRNLVVMTQDQHSFDNYFGIRDGVDGIPSGVCVPVTALSSTPCVTPFLLKASGLKPNLLATATAQEVSVAGGLMNGFVQAQTTPRTDGSGSMGYYSPSDLPVITQLADQGVLFDHWFSALPGAGIVNRLFAMSGAVTPDTDQVPAAGWTDLPVIFDRLQAAGVPWKVYVENYVPTLTVATAALRARRGGQVARVPLLALSRYENNPALMSHIADLGTYFSDLADGSLPAVSWIVTTSSTERPPADPTAGQREVRNVVNALGESSAWPNSAFLLTYDSSGGWYDHVAPPTEQGAALGLRVPTLLISPYATPGLVDHAQLDSASVLKFIETNWSLTPLTARDAGATDLATALTFGRPPHEPTTVGPSATSLQVPVPNRSIIYGVYLLAALGVAVIVSWAALGGRLARAALGGRLARAALGGRLARSTEATTEPM
jgi:phospholipase C